MSLSENIRSARDCRQGRARERGNRTETARRRGVFRFLCTRARQRASERSDAAFLLCSISLSSSPVAFLTGGSRRVRREKKKDGWRERKGGKERARETERAPSRRSADLARGMFYSPIFGSGVCYELRNPRRWYPRRARITRS